MSSEPESKETLAQESDLKEESNDAEGAKYFDPVTGEPISKNAFKKLQKGPKKEKKEKPVPSPKSEESSEKKEKKEKKVKEPEQIWEDNTPIGEKKILSEAFPPTYQPKYVEAAWQSWWEKSGFYSPNLEEALKKGEEDKFVMVIPPPNVTGSLHLGHALTSAIEDTLTRWHRMNGKITLWVPGTDHAGIATQSVVEKRLKKEENLSRRDLGREEFVKRVWEWKEKYGGRITTQIRSLGASVDWSREAFTMDENLSRAVTEAFVRFHEDGILYRDTRLINWSCALQSAISEIEVDYIDLEGRTFLPVPNHREKEKYEFGMITSFAYKVAPIEGQEEGQGEGEIVVATTRLETMLGDSAVAVHPEDERYKRLHGRFLIHPFSSRLIPIICDPQLVDMSFGTGAVKVTPAHDPNDYQCGKRHGLDFLTVFSEDGRVNHTGGKFAGLMRYDARIAIEAELTSLGLFRGKEPNKMRLGLCSRSGDIIEPMLTPQWYVSCQSMATRSIEAVRSGELKILPECHEATWYRWLENIRDWCVSRQLWWGHRIPAYFTILSPAKLASLSSTPPPAESSSSPTLILHPNNDKNDQLNNDRWIVARTIEDAQRIASEKFSLSFENGDFSLEQDEDVLDTWFSSGLFPWSVFGWPNNTEDMKAFYPTQLLETGLDILFFWVARMVMMGLQLTDTLPFKTVYLHAMVRDKYGRKMSKSLGNVIDPLEVINGCSLEDLLVKIDEGNLPAKEVTKAKEGQAQDFPEGIPECGADALRFGLLAYTVQGRDVNLDIKRVVGYRQFCNKLWNAVRFALTYLTDFVPSEGMGMEIVRDPLVNKRDLFILSRLHATINECNLQMKNYVFGGVTTALHSFFLYDVCDLYLELVKPIMNIGTLPLNSSSTDPSASSPPPPPPTPEELRSKYLAQATLYTVLEQFLRLAHPLMPFVTEELWQRLPNRSSLTSVPSIMIASYPMTTRDESGAGTWFAPEIERDMEILKQAIHDGRSLRSDYKVPNHIKADFYFQSSDPIISMALTQQSQDFMTLAKGNFFQSLSMEETAPKGCCVKVMNDSCSLYVNLSGIIDISQEILRLNKEIERLTPMIQSYQKKMTASDYSTKVPESVQKLNAEKLSSFEAELQATLSAKKAFEEML